MLSTKKVSTDLPACLRWPLLRCVNGAAPANISDLVTPASVLPNNSATRDVGEVGGCRGEAVVGSACADALCGRMEKSSGSSEGNTDARRTGVGGDERHEVKRQPRFRTVLRGKTLSLPAA